VDSFPPYLFQAASFYRATCPSGGDRFRFVFICAQLDGPLIHLEFESVLGVTGRFGYHLDLRIPAAVIITSFSFIVTHTLVGHAISAGNALQRLTSSRCQQLQRSADANWAIAGQENCRLRGVSNQRPASNSVRRQRHPQRHRRGC
jgi:hypothetical protein